MNCRKNVPIGVEARFVYGVRVVVEIVEFFYEAFVVTVIFKAAFWEGAAAIAIDHDEEEETGFGAVAFRAIRAGIKTESRPIAIS